METSCFRASRSFRDRCKGSGLFFFEMHFRGRRSALDMAMSGGDRQRRDFWTCGSLADFVAGVALGEP